MSNVVILGAGQTGRGYINRLLSLSNQKVTFLDIDEDLVASLSNSKYAIRFGGNEREALEIDNYAIYHPLSHGGKMALSNADYVFTAIGMNNLRKCNEYILSALDQRTRNVPLRIVTCENGVNPKQEFGTLNNDPRVLIAEGIVFCTTLNDGLDILSENLDWVPYDVRALHEPISYYGFAPEEGLDTLLERKIYTYNCISACVAYLGACKGYTNYADAANDDAINALVHKVRDVIDVAVGKEFKVSESEQREFSDNAIRKFRNRYISDTVERNVRDVSRKLGEKERIIAPLRLMQKYGLESNELLYVVACAICYGVTSGEFSEGYNLESFMVGFPESWIKTTHKYVEELLHD